MKKRIRIAFRSVFLLALLSAFLLCAFSVGAEAGDPSESYQKQTAPYEDASIHLWFEHSSKKVMTSDITPSGMDTYSVYMAKNEAENAQFVLFSEETKSGLRASIGDFTNEKGEIIPAEIYYQMYITTENLDMDSVLGCTAEDSIIREGETPDPIAPLDRIGSFTLNANKSQAFYIKLISDTTTPSGWYSSQLNIKNAEGQTVKTATVYCYVWDFALPESTTLQSSFYIANRTTTGGTYEEFYEYLLENRLMPMDMPGGFYATNPYLTDERVSAVRVTATGGGYAGDTYVDPISSYPKYQELYNELSNTDYWEDIKDKLYFYSIDEPRSQEICDQDTVLFRTNTVDGAIECADRLKSYWPGAEIVIPQYDNHPYPYYTYHKPLENYSSAELSDAVQALMDSESITIWCPMMFAFTPESELDAFGYNGTPWSQIRSFSGSNSGNYTTGSAGAWSYHTDHYNWEKLYGEFSDRTLSNVAYQKSLGNKYQLWGYLCGYAQSYTYANHLIESTGLQTKMLFWQLYQEDCTGYLYYGTNNWFEYDSNNDNYSDHTVTGAKTNVAWKPNKHTYGSGHSIYGNGVLFYGMLQGKINGESVIGTTRVELMRDGVEEYEMLTMLEKYAGEKEAKAVVSRVSESVVNYLSLPGFDDSAFDASLNEYDIMELVRRDLGNTLERLTEKGHCSHSYGEGVIIEEPACLTIGYTRYTCEKCGHTKDEVIPTLHTVGDCFTKVSGSSATCTSDGAEIFECSICSYQKTVKTPAHHNNPEMYDYTSRNGNMHICSCKACGSDINEEFHTLFEENTATCTEGGESISYCSKCDYRVTIGATEPRGHYLKEYRKDPTCTEEGFEGMACTRCDYKEGNAIEAKGHRYGDDKICIDCNALLEYMTGDLDGDFEISAKDLNIIKRYLGGLVDLTDIQRLAGDVNEDGEVSAVDMNRIVRYLAGTISGF